jgi:Fe-S-cluster containining protein
MNWREIYETEFFQAPGCYLECGGYCCNNFFGKYYRFLDSESVVLPLIDDEYEIYRKRGGIENVDAKKYEIEVKPRKKLVFYLLHCREKGLCKPHTNRPLICRIYPYLPKLDDWGKGVGWQYASLMDIFYSSAQRHSCPLVRENAETIKREIMENMPAWSPKMILALQLIDALIENIKTMIPEKIDTLNEEEQRALIAKFEMLILSGKAFKAIDMAGIYDRLAKVHGDFL